MAKDSVHKTVESDSKESKESKENKEGKEGKEGEEGVSKEHEEGAEGEHSDNENEDEDESGAESSSSRPHTPGPVKREHKLNEEMAKYKMLIDSPLVREYVNMGIWEYGRVMLDV